MLLAIDAGNTALSFALFRDGSIVYRWSILTETFLEWHAHQKERNAPPNAFSWTEFLSLDKTLPPQEHARFLNVPLQDLQDIILSCVVPRALPAIQSFAQTVLPAQKESRLLILGTPLCPFPTHALIAHPETAGSDLRVNAFAAHTLYTGPLLVIGLGTATTVTLVDHQGNFCGTAIAPGIQVSLKALGLSAEQLPELFLPEKRPPFALGTTTEDAILSGVFWGQVGLVNTWVSHFKDQASPQEKTVAPKNAPDRSLLTSSSPLKVIATGGFSSLIGPACSGIDHVDPDLTLKGLALIYTTFYKRKPI